MKNGSMFVAALMLATAGFTALAAGRASAHCDTMDGPVIKAAQSALAAGDVNPVLAWVHKDDEAEIQAAFKHTLEVRKLGPEARKLADSYFFETLVRVHRAGEGAPYTGVKPAGQDIGPALSAADKALETKKSDEMLALVGDAVREGIEKRFKAVVALSNYKPDDVEAGRRYVAAYVEYVHYVEGIYNATTGPVEHHTEASAAVEQHGQDHH